MFTAFLCQRASYPIPQGVAGFQTLKGLRGRGSPSKEGHLCHTLSHEALEGSAYRYTASEGWVLVSTGHYYSLMPFIRGTVAFTRGLLWPNLCH